MVDPTAGILPAAQQEFARRAAIRDAHQAGVRRWERQRRQSRAVVVDMICEWHRHTRRNWQVLRQIIEGMEARKGIPLDCHVEKLRYVDDHALFDHGQLTLMSDAARRLIHELRPIIRNTNLEIDELLRALGRNDAEEILGVAGLVLRKFQYLFVEKLPSIVEAAERANFTVDATIDPLIVAARQQEKAARGQNGREDIVYRAV
ncbi:hypothetical protein [Sphingomonas endophytica]|uniref:Uncharacterized protein n=1 Tax=Sphingomonas endophytica TaxID=869719 RepID=A0A147I9H1_9SPHN|nr:hypothetical protein [Sphingomonas endophytica]KTT76234.1 hypothetical protein NS334_01280 [Sphingomonas endophytica]